MRGNPFPGERIARRLYRAVERRGREHRNRAGWMNTRHVVDKAQFYNAGSDGKGCRHEIVFGHMWSSRNPLWERDSTSVPALVCNRRHELRVCSNSLKSDTGYQCSCAVKRLCLLLVESAPRRQNIARWLRCIPCLPALTESHPVGVWPYIGR